MADSGREEKLAAARRKVRSLTFYPDVCSADIGVSLGVIRFSFVLL